MGKELIICPNCQKPTMEKRSVYPLKEVKETPLTEYAEQIIEYERQKHEGSYPSSGDIYTFGEMVKAIQFVFRCSTCDYTKVYDV